MSVHALPVHSGSKGEKVTHLHAMIFLAVGIVGSYLVAESLDCDLFSMIVGFLLKMFFEPLFFFLQKTFQKIQPLIHALIDNGIEFPAHIFTFAIDCAIAGGESILWAMNKIGIE
jgi:hypothetical protein